MTDRTTAGNGKTSRRKTGIHERVIFVVPCYEKKGLFYHSSYNMILLTPVRLIIVPLALPRLQTSRTDKEGERISSKTGDTARTRESSLLGSLASRGGDYLDREADEILLEEKDARVIPLGDIREIVIRRVRTDSRSSRWLSIFFALYPLEPAAARYSVNYQLTIMTPGHLYSFITPFSLQLKQILVDHFDNRVHEIVDEVAPLL